MALLLQWHEVRPKNTKRQNIQWKFNFKVAKWKNGQTCFCGKHTSKMAKSFEIVYESANLATLFLSAARKLFLKP